MRKPNEAAKSRNVSSHALEVSQSSHCAVVRLPTMTADEPAMREVSVVDWSSASN